MNHEHSPRAPQPETLPHTRPVFTYTCEFPSQTGSSSLSNFLGAVCCPCAMLCSWVPIETRTEAVVLHYGTYTGTYTVPGCTCINCFGREVRTLLYPRSSLPLLRIVPTLINSSCLCRCASSRRQLSPSTWPRPKSSTRMATPFSYPLSSCTTLSTQSARRSTCKTLSTSLGFRPPPSSNRSFHSTRELPTLTCWCSLNNPDLWHLLFVVLLSTLILDLPGMKARGTRKRPASRQRLSRLPTNCGARSKRKSHRLAPFARAFNSTKFHLRPRLRLTC